MIDQIWGWIWALFYLEGWRITKLHIITLISQYVSGWFLMKNFPWQSKSQAIAGSQVLNFWVISVYIADVLSHKGNGSDWSNMRLKMSVSALGRFKNHNAPHLHPNFTMFMPLNRLQLKICAFSGKFNVCSKWVLLSWIEIYRDFTLQTQIFTQKYRSWLRFYSEFLRKNLAAGVSVLNSSPT